MALHVASAVVSNMNETAEWRPMSIRGVLSHEARSEASQYDGLPDVPRALPDSEMPQSPSTARTVHHIGLIQAEDLPAGQRGRYA